jgi:hypothetical protein
VADPARPLSADPERRSRLLAVKLAALVRDHTGVDGGEAATFAGGAALVRPDGAWVLVAERPDRAVGAALAWASRRSVDVLHLLVDDDGVPARQSAWFDAPPRVWRVEGRELRPGVPQPLALPADLDPRLAALRPLIVEGGAEPVVEHGVLSGEVFGLEVCRAVRDPITGVPRLEVGVGAHDREAFQLLHGDVPPVDALAGVVERVAAVRSDPGASHPLRRLCAERLLRWQLLQDPRAIGLAALAAAPPPTPRHNLKDPTPCVAVGDDRTGRHVVAVVSVGIDLGLVPFAADARAALAADPDVRLVLVVPARDDHPATRRLAQRLREPAEVIALDS